MSKSIQTLTSLLIERSKNSTKSICFISAFDKENIVSYAELYDSALRLLYLLQETGLSTGDTLIFQIEDNQDFIKTFWACILGGIIPVPLTVGNNDESKLKVFRIINILQNPYIIGTEKTLHNLIGFENSSKTSEPFTDIVVNSINIDNLKFNEKKGAIFTASEDDTAFIQFSSGSTGDPKGVVLTHKNLITNSEAIVEGIGVTPDESSLSWMPLTHDMGLIGFHLAPLYADCNQYLMPTSLFIRRPTLWLKKASDYKINILSSPNFGYKYILNFLKGRIPDNRDLSSIRLIFNGAEPISDKICRDFIDTFKPYGLKDNVIFPVYGLAEASLAVTFTIPSEQLKVVHLDRSKLAFGDKIEFCNNPEYENISSFVDVGSPVKNCSVRICDSDNKPLEDEIVGNICIKGLNVTKGYYNNTIDTKNLITEDGWLKTGDLGFMTNNRLIITGRAKDIIFVNGQNFYSHDIERISQEVNGIGLGEVIACGINENGKDIILLFILFKGEIAQFLNCADDVKNHIFLKTGIEIHSVIPIKKVPKTTSGKIQRFKLVEKYINKEFVSEIKEIEDARNKLALNKKIAKPENELEMRMLRIWESVFKQNSIGTDSKLFDLGADSLLLMQMVADISREFNFDVPINVLIENNTIQKLCDYIAKTNADISSLTTKSSAVLSIHPEAQYNPFPLTDIQMAYFMGREENFELGNISTHYYVEYECCIDIEKFNRSLQNVIKRHPMMRCTILKNGQQQIIENTPDYIIHVSDYSMKSENEVQQLILSERSRMSHFIFQTDKWPLFEFKAFKLEQNKYYIFIGFDLLIADGPSLKIIMNEIMQLYYDENIILPEIKVSFRDYVLSYKAYIAQEKFNRDKEYWLKKIDIMPPPPSLPVIKGFSEIEKPYFSRKSLTIDPVKWANIKTIALENQITASALLLTIYSYVLTFWSNQPHHAINLTVFNRYPFSDDISKIAGDFTSLIILEMNMKNGVTFWDKVRNTQQSLFEALEHKDFDGVNFLREYNVYHSYPNTKAVMPVVFTGMLSNEKDFSISEKSIGTLQYSISQTSQVILDCQISESEKGILITWDYIENLFDPHIIDSMFSHFTGVIETINEKENINPEVSLKDLELIKNYNNTVENIPITTLHQLFINQTAKKPENIAIKENSYSITYHELNKKSNEVAHFLISNNIGKNDKVCVSGKRKIETFINILGILKSGAAYVPLEADYPEERIQYIRTNCNSRFILTPELYHREISSKYSDQDPECVFNPDDIAYIIYTSGSTGKPKGVVINHKAAANTIIDINQKYNVTESDRIIGISSLCFDLSVYDIFGAFAAGGTLVLIRDQRDVKELIRAVENEKITIWNSVPAIVNMFVDNLSIKKSNSNTVTKDTVLDKKTVYKWSPVMHWGMKNNDLFINNIQYKSEYASLFPDFYFHAQKGISLSDAYNHFSSTPESDVLNFFTEIVSEKILVNTLLKPREIFATQDTLFINNYDESIIYDSDKLKAFKKQQVTRNAAQTNTAEITLRKDKSFLPETMINRRTHRKFNENYLISEKTFSNFLTVLSSESQNDDFRYFYPSAGGLYPIDIYIYVKENRIEGFKKGLYYYNPVLHNLIMVNDSISINDEAHFFTNKEIYNSSAATIFLIYNAEVTMPKYGSMGYYYAAIDSGIIISTLTTMAETFGIGICSIGDMNFDLIEQGFNLNNNQIFLHAIEVGIKSDANQNLLNDFFINKKEFTTGFDKDVNYIENNLRVIMMSGDWIPLTLPEKIKQYFPAADIYSLGGATEASIWSIHYPIKNVENCWKSIPYGMPLANQTFYVLNYENKLCPPEVTGELYIGGVGLAREYFNDYEKTNNAFIQHPLFGRLYKTGDYGVFHKKGYIEFLGRKDSQVKIKGYRIELGEIETKLLSHPDIINAVVIDKTDSSGKKFLCGYITADTEVSSDTIKNYLSESLPEYMIPGFIQRIDEIPLTPNGKVDRKKLPEPDTSVYKKDIVLPSNDIEFKLFSIFKDVLNISDFGVTDNFFNLGGDSLNATTLVSIIENEFNIYIPLARMFREATVRELANTILASEKKIESQKNSNLILLKQSKSHNNVFFIHAGSGEIEVYIELTENLKVEAKYWAIRAERYDNNGPFNATIEELASDYIQIIKEIQPEGPYNLTGWCLGGTIAFEMARQLEDMGEEINFIGLLNSLAPQRGILENEVPFSVETEVGFIETYFPDFSIHDSVRNSESSQTFWKLILNHFKESNFDNVSIKQRIPAELKRLIPNFDNVDRDKLLFYINIFRSFQMTRAFYIPVNKISAEIHFFEAMDENVINKDNWQQYSTGKVQYYTLKGDHVSIMRSPNITENSVIFNNVLSELII